MLQDRPTSYRSYTLNSTNQLRSGIHLSLPAQSVVGWLPSIPYARHHFVISKVDRSAGKVEVIELSGANKSSARIQKRIIFLKTRLRAGDVVRHTYGKLKTYPAREVIERGKLWLGKPGVFGNSFGFRSNNCEVAATYFMVGLGFSAQTGYYHLPK